MRIHTVKLPCDVLTLKDCWLIPIVQGRPADLSLDAQNAHARSQTDAHTCSTARDILKLLPSWSPILVFACVCENLCACVKETKKGKLRKSDHSAAKSHGMTITGYFRKSFTSVLTGTGVCVCWYACVWQRDGERAKRCAGSGNLWTPTHSQFYLHPEYDIQNFTRKSRGREDKKMANSSRINKSPSTNIKQLL